LRTLADKASLRVRAFAVARVALWRTALIHIFASIGDVRIALIAMRALALVPFSRTHGII